ncbi:MAG: cytochrome c oxidase assembly protein [Pseudomonadota bacterium]|nr:cytochrome c oxidase assembly protein [Pseudomonadota bacterium]
MRTAVLCVAVLFGMTGAAFAAVPLYRAFCQATGFDGTVRRADAAPKAALNRTVEVRFDANTRNLPWSFKPSQVRQTVKIGETGLAFYTATNTSDRPVTGTAVFNVVPEAAGPHFRKVECFCFTEQTIEPGRTVEFPVVYFVDPELVSDPDARRIDEITLSYTFYPAKPSAAPAG